MPVSVRGKFLPVSVRVLHSPVGVREVENGGLDHLQVALAVHEFPATCHVNGEVQQRLRPGRDSSLAPYRKSSRLWGGLVPVEELVQRMGPSGEKLSRASSSASRGDRTPSWYQPWYLRESRRATPGTPHDSSHDQEYTGGLATTEVAARPRSVDCARWA